MESIFELSTREISIVTPRDELEQGLEGMMETAKGYGCLSNIRSNVVLTRPGLASVEGETSTDQPATGWKQFTDIHSEIIDTEG